ncbi:HAD family phosphatase [Phormidesmis priestleyi ULC007]|uniref:HAD family phosphatase n=1 Tax=Phormidesmis priestleyi ULC007 TaxID=1920490 RepID=A0A2T1DLH5_9CYAN|nr:HAD family hydrolase [Phormidesmis priestleyi]PSB21305.1 HAD family phosphatase [Phormidesmis priestleyi ULC007]PZO50676.1 MAG: HAD family phosphatase [Phormidesmis priestleyi]
MSFIPIAQADTLHDIRLVATDMDGTLTIAEKFTPNLLKAFETLTTSGIQIVIITGRSAGWVNGLAHYLPVVGAIAENGGLFYLGESEILLTPIADLNQHRHKLADSFERLKTEFPQIRESSDNRFRLTDWTFDVEGLSLEALDTIAQLCQSWGWSFTYSTVQCHIKPLQQNKAAGLLKVLTDYFPHYSSEQILTVGDSPNDESLFDARLFPNSIGVANSLNYADRLLHKPTYVTTASEGEGFCELVNAIVHNE